MLSPERQGRMTGSRVRILMNGSDEELLSLWREMRGEQEPEDLSQNFAVQLGKFTEPFHLKWISRGMEKKLSREGEFVKHPVHDWAAVTLDGFWEDLRGPVETKHCGGYQEYNDVREFYIAQPYWQMICTQTDKCAFSVIQGNRAPVVEIIEYDTEYGSELWKRAYDFMECVWSGKPPVVLPPVPAPVPAIKTYDMTGNNSWAANAFVWLENLKAAKDHATAVKELKVAVPADAKKCFGHGITVSRNKAGALTIREA